MTTLRAALLLVFCCFLLVPRAAADERDRIAEVLVVADIGAGKGAWSVDLARRVGSTGRVYATEIDPVLLRDIERAVVAAGAPSVTVVEGSATDTNLPMQCCDAILLRLVYHHFTDPHAMDRSMFAALHPGG